MTLLIRRSFLRLAVALGVTMALPVSASLPAERVGLEAARADAEAGRALLVDIREPHEHATGVALTGRVAGAARARLHQCALRRGRDVGMGTARAAAGQASGTLKSLFAIV